MTLHSLLLKYAVIIQLLTGFHPSCASAVIFKTCQDQINCSVDSHYPSGEQFCYHAFTSCPPCFCTDLVCQLYLSISLFSLCTILLSCHVSRVNMYGNNSSKLCEFLLKILLQGKNQSVPSNPRKTVSQEMYAEVPCWGAQAGDTNPQCGAGIAKRVSALDWLSLRYAAIITLPVSNPGLCP